MLPTTSFSSPSCDVLVVPADVLAEAPGQRTVQAAGQLA